MEDDDKNALGPLGRQEVLTALIIVILGMIPVSAGITLYFVFTHPDLIQSIEITGAVNVGKFVDKVVESYDAFLVLLGVGVGASTALALSRRKPN